MKKKSIIALLGVGVTLSMGLTFLLGQENGKNEEKFKRTTAEERLSEILDVPILTEEYTSEEITDGDNTSKEVEEYTLKDFKKDNLKVITERVGYTKEGKVNLWVTLDNVNNVEMRSFNGNILNNGLRYKEEYIKSNSVNDLLQVQNGKDKEDKADKVYLILDNSNLYLDYDIYSDTEAEEINSKYKVVSSNGLKVDLMLEYSMGYKSKIDTLGKQYLEEISLVNNSKEKQKYTLKVYTKSNVKSNGLGTLIYDNNKILNNRETYIINLRDIFSSGGYEESKLIWVLKVESAKDKYKAEETDIIIEVK